MRTGSSSPDDAASFLYRHRALATLPHRRWRFPAALALAVCLTAIWILALPAAGTMGAALLATLKEAFDLPGHVVLSRYVAADRVWMTVPYLDLPAAAPGQLAWIVTAGAVLLVTAGSFALPERMLPFSYFLRAVALVQGTALFYFAFWPESFPYTLGAYLKGMTVTGLFVVSLVPLVLGATYYLLDVHLWQKVALTAIIMGHLTVGIPLQFLLQGLLLHHASLLFLPLCYLLFGLPLNVFTFVALYAWGMSWPGLPKRAHTTPMARVREPSRRRHTHPRTATRAA